DAMTLYQRGKRSEILVAADKRSEFTGKMSLSSCDRCRRGLCSGGAGTVVRTVPRRGDESITAPRHGRDHMRTQQLAQAADVRRDVVPFHHDVPPDQVEQLLLGHQALAPPCQYQREVERARTDGDIPAVYPQHAFGGTDFKPAKAKRFVIASRRHGLQSLAP